MHSAVGGVCLTASTECLNFRCWFISVPTTAQADVFSRVRSDERLDPRPLIFLRLPLARTSGHHPGSVASPPTVEPSLHS